MTTAPRRLFAATLVASALLVPSAGAQPARDWVNDGSFHLWWGDYYTRHAPSSQGFRAGSNASWHNISFAARLKADAAQPTARRSSRWR